MKNGGMAGAWQARQQSTQAAAKIASLKREKKRIKEEADRKIREAKATLAAETASIHSTAEQLISDIRRQTETPKEIVAGDWYIAAYCHACLYPIPLLRDVTNGKAGLAGPGVLRARCQRPECGHEAEYPTDQAVSLQALETGSLPGPRPQE